MNFEFSRQYKSCNFGLVDFPPPQFLIKFRDSYYWNWVELIKAARLGFHFSNYVFSCNGTESTYLVGYQWVALSLSVFPINAGITRVFYGSDFVTVTKSEDASWEFLKPEIFAAIMDFYSSGQPLFLDSKTAAAMDTAIHEVLLLSLILYLWKWVESCDACTLCCCIHS